MRYTLLALGAVMAVVGCSKPEPAAITIEPVYTGKYGAAVSVPDQPPCRPQSQPVSITYVAALPTCESLCPAGQQPSYDGQTITHLTVLPRCVPINERQPNDPQRPQMPNCPPTRVCI